MSDINIRFDGLILLIGLALGTVGYSLIAVIALAFALIGSRARAWKIAWLAGAMAVGTCGVTAVFFGWWDRHGPVYFGPEWVDRLTYPWAIVFLAGCWWLARVR